MTCRSDHLISPLFLIIFFIFSAQLVNLSHGIRKDPAPGDYWSREDDQIIIKGGHDHDKTMPKALEEMILPHSPMPMPMDMDRFTRDFDVKPNVIIYHKHLSFTLP